MRLLIALAVWIVAVGAAVEVSSVVADSIHTTPANATVGAGGGSAGGSGESESSRGGSAGSPPVDPSSIKSTDRLSMFREANLARALAAARKQLGTRAKVDNFVIYPGYLSITAVKGNSEVDFYLDANGRSSRSSGASASATGVFSLATVRSSVPPALARRISRAAGVPESRLHYMVAEIAPVSNKFRWLVYTVAGSNVEYFQAAGADGPLLEYRANSSTGLQRVGG